VKGVGPEDEPEGFFEGWRGARAVAGGILAFSGLFLLLGHRFGGVPGLVVGGVLALALAVAVLRIVLKVD
jgi:hypothetical protein